MKKYEVAISFSTPDISFAKEIYSRLRSKNVKAYYYIHTPEETLGSNLKNKLKKIYGDSTLVVVVHSENYLTDYTEIELKAALIGNSKKEGVIPVKIDDSPLPQILRGRTYWDLKYGTDELILTILKKLKKPKPREFYSLLLVSISVSLALGYISLTLGFNNFNRFPDMLFIFLATLPIMWFFLFKILPDQIKKHRLKKLKGDNLLQSPIERNLERTNSIAKVVAIFVTILVTIYSTYQRNDIVNKYNDYLNFDSSLEIQFGVQTKLLKNLSSKIANASTKVLPQHLEDSKMIQLEIKTISDSIKTINNKLNTLLANQAFSISDSISNNYIANITQCDRVIDKYINYQINELAKDKSYLGYDSWTDNRINVSKILINYNTLFVTSILKLDESFQFLKQESALNAEKIRMKWKGII